MNKRVKPVFCSETEINLMLQNGEIDAHDLLFLREGKVAWIDHNKNVIFATDKEALKAISDYIGVIPEDVEAETIVEYIQQMISNIETEMNDSVQSIVGANGTITVTRKDGTSETLDTTVEYVEAYTVDGVLVLSNNHNYETINALIDAHKAPIIYRREASGAMRYYYFTMRYHNSDGTEPLEFRCDYGSYGYKISINPDNVHKLTYYMFVNTSRMINGYKLDTDINLTAEDVGADEKGSSDKALFEAQKSIDDKISAEKSAREAGDTKNLSDSKDYTDKKLADAETARKLDDANNLDAAKKYSDDKLKSAVDALTQADTDNMQAIRDYVDDLNEVIDDKFPKTPIISDCAETIVLHDSADDPLQSLRLFGKTDQFSTTGTQLFDKDNAKFVNGITYNASVGSFQDNDYNVMGMYYMDAEPNTTYFISKSVGNNLRVCTCSKIPALGVAATRINDNTSENSCIITTGENDKYISFYLLWRAEYDGGITYESVLETLMVAKSTVAVPYEPYTGGIPSPNPQYPQELKSAGDGGQISVQIGDTTEEDVQYLIMETPNGLPGIPVTDSGLANYTDESGQMWCADEVDFERGVYVQRLKSIIVTGDLINQYFSDEGYARVTLNDMYMKYGRLEVKSNRFIFNKSGKDEGTIFAYINDIRLYKACSSLDDTREWFDKNEVRVIYILANPIETSLSDEELAQYASLCTHFPTTTIQNDSDTYMQVKYNANTQVYVETVREEILQAVDEDMAELSAEITTLEARTDLHEEIVNDLSADILDRGTVIHGYDEGRSIVIYDSSSDPIKALRIYGQTEQFTTTGKNLWNPEWVMSAYFFTDGIIANSTTKMIYIPCEPNTTYTVSKLETTRLSIAYTTVEPGTGTAVYGYITYTGTTSSAGTITTGDDAAYLVAYVYNTNNDTSVTFEEMLASIQIEKGSDATDYEPYTGGIASPSPAYPQELVSAGDGGDIELDVCGGNLKVTFEQGAFGVSTGESISAAGWTSANRLKTPLLENKDYNITSLEPGYQIYPVVGDSVVMAYDKARWHDLPYAHIANGYVYTRFLFRKSDNSEIGTDAPIMIFDCEETEVQSLTVSTPNGLPGIPVTDASLATYTDESGQMWCCDEVDLERGVYVQRVEGVSVSAFTSFNVNENYAAYNTNGKISRLTGRIPTVSNYFRYDNKIATSGVTFGYGNAVRFYFDSSEVNTLELANQWLSEHDDLYVIYPLATPIETPLSESELAVYKALHTNYPVTTVLNDVGAHMELQYHADTKNYIDNKFTELQNAILSMGGNV